MALLAVGGLVFFWSLPSKHSSPPRPAGPDTAALAVLLGRSHHRDRLHFGVATHNRRGAVEKRAIGLFVGLMPLTVRLKSTGESGDTGESGGSVGDLVQRVATELRAGYRRRRTGS